MRLGVIGAQALGLRKAVQGLVDPIQLGERNAPTAMRFGEVRPQLERPVVALNRLVKASQVGERGATTAMGPGEILPQCQRAIVAFHGLRISPEFAKNAAAMHIGFRIIRPRRDRTGEAHEGFGKTPLHGESAAEIIQGDGVARILFQHETNQPHGLRMVAKLMKRDAKRMQAVKVTGLHREYLLVDVFRFANAAILVQLGGVGEQRRDRLRLPAPEFGQTCRIGSEFVLRRRSRRNVRFFHHRPVSAEQCCADRAVISLTRSNH